MNSFQSRKAGMSSQLSVKTTRKKAANVTVGNSMRPGLPSLGKGTASRQPGFAGAGRRTREQVDIAYHGGVTDSPIFTQNTLREGVVEFAFGEPDPALLPVGLVREAAARALGAGGAAALAYGSNPGPEALRAAIAARTAAREGLALTADDVLVSGGNSQALDQALTMLTEPGDVVFVECPTYNLALGIIADHPVDVVGVPLDGDGLDVDALEAAVGDVRASGRRPRLLYTIPTFHNPAGVSLSAPRRRRLLGLARREDLILVEDDVYRELVYTVRRRRRCARSTRRRPSCASARSRSRWRRASASAGSTPRRPCASGSPAAGMRRERRLRQPVLRARGRGAPRGRRLRRPCRRPAPRLRLAPRRPRGARSRGSLPAGCSLTCRPAASSSGSRCRRGCRRRTCLPVAERHGVAFAPGRRFCTDGDDRSLRLAFSLYDEASLSEGGLATDRGHARRRTGPARG